MTAAGFFLSNVFVTTAMATTLYYMFSLAMTGMDKAILATNFVYLVGDLNIANWIAQLGLLTIIPLWILYWLEYGFWNSASRMLRGIGALSPVFFMFGIQVSPQTLFTRMLIIGVVENETC